MSALAYVMLGVFILAVMLWMLWLWLREARIEQIKLPAIAVLGVLVAVVFGGALYAFLGYQTGTKELLDNRAMYAELADHLSQGGELSGEEAAEHFTTNDDVLQFALVLQNRLATQPTSSGWQMLSNIYANLGAFEQAKQAGYAALELENSHDNKLWLAQVALQENEGALNAEAFNHIQAVLREAPEHNGAWLTLAMAATEAKEYDLAEEAWQVLYDRNQDNAETRRLFERSLEFVQEQRGTHELFNNIEVRVEAEGDVAPGGSLFVYLRHEGSAGQPLAARRVLANKLPMTVTFSSDDWLGPYPTKDVDDLVVGARYNPSGSRNVSDAGITSPTVPWHQGETAVVTLAEEE